MKTKFTTPLLVLFFICFTANFSKAQQIVPVSKGDKYFFQNQFEDAIACYMSELTSKNKKIAENAMVRLADCYRITGEFEKAEVQYKKIMKRKKKNPQNYMNYGLSLKNSAKFEEAKVQFEEYIRLKPEDPMGPVFLKSCDSAQKWLDATIGKEVKNLEAINSEYSDFSPVIKEGADLFFCSGRKGSKEVLFSLEGGNETHRLDIYKASITAISGSEVEKNTVKNYSDLNTPLHEGSLCFSKDGKEVYFTRTVKGKRNETTNDILNSLNIYYSKRDSAGKWTAPDNNFPFNYAGFSSAHPALSPDGKTLFFMSDVKGGYGKTDIYYCTKDSKGNWGKVTNAGKDVNTFGFELFPYVSDNNVLYFSSNSHPGMGQLDIFKSELVHGAWTKVHNLMPPINSIGNDFGITFNGNVQQGFFSSDRFNGKGQEDIYSFSYQDQLEINVCNDSVFVKDNSIFDDQRYKLVNETDSTEREIISGHHFFRFKMHANKDLSLICKKNGFSANSITLKYEVNNQAQTVNYKIVSDRVKIKVNFIFVQTNPLTHTQCNTIIKTDGINSDALPVHFEDKLYETTKETEAGSELLIELTTNKAN